MRWGIGKNFKHLIKYCIIGCSGAGLDFLLYSLLVLLTPWHYQWINLLSTSCGILNNFFLNAWLNFKIKDHLLLRLCSFYAVGLIGIVLIGGPGILGKGGHESPAFFRRDPFQQIRRKVNLQNILQMILGKAVLCFGMAVCKG